MEDELKISIARVRCYQRGSECKDYECSGIFLVHIKTDHPASVGDRCSFHPTSACPHRDVSIEILNIDDEYTRFKFKMDAVKKMKKA